MTVDVVVKHGQMLVHGDLVEGGLAVDDGKISLIAKETHLPPASTTIDARGGIILPGSIDTHVHLRDPGPPDYSYEDFLTGTAAAACGGVTTVLEMPMEAPYISTVAALNDKKADCKTKALVDYALYGGVDPSRLDGISELAKEGVIGYKILMWPPYQTGSSLFPVTSDDKSLVSVLSEIAKTGLPASIHAENWEIIEYYTEMLKKQGRKDPLAHCDSRPVISETEAISRAILLAKEYRVRLLIAHMSTKGGVELVRSAKKAKQDVSAETCPHYLLLTRDDLSRMFVKISPPLRSRLDADALWEGINDGTIDSIGSDHTARLEEDAEIGRSDIWTVSAGTRGVETRLPLMLGQVNSGRLTLGRLVQVMSENAARIFGLYPQKGVIQVGSDADFVIVDMKKEYEIRNEQLHSKIKSTIFSGWRVKGVPIATLVRGQLIMEDGKVVAKPGSGRFLAGKRKEGK
jgi:D-hydantoinase